MLEEITIFEEILVWGMAEIPLLPIIRRNLDKIVYPEEVFQIFSKNRFHLKFSVI